MARAKKPAQKKVDEKATAVDEPKAVEPLAPQKVQDAQAGLIAEALVNLDELHQLRSYMPIGVYTSIGILRRDAGRAGQSRRRGWPALVT